MQKKWLSSVIFAELFYFLLVFFSLLQGMAKTHGNFVYPLDDPYIHAAIAKNFLLHGVWGVTPFAFTSTTSSPLWTLLLTVCFFFTAVFDAGPFLLNLIFGVLLVASIFSVFYSNTKSNPRSLFYTCILIVIIPLPALVLSGMEHTLHLLFSGLFIIHAVRIADTPVDKFSLRAYFLFSLAFLLPVIRYESLFLIFVTAIFFLFYKRYWLALGLVAFSFFSIALYGFFCTNHGWPFIPNSILQKTTVPGFCATPPADYFTNLFQHKFVTNHNIAGFSLIAVVFFIIARNSWKATPRRIRFTAIVLLTTLIHLLFAKLGWFYRYEAYLFFLNGISFLLLLDTHLLKFIKLPSKNYLSFGLAFLLLIAAGFIFHYRGIISMQEIPGAMENIYEQQFQTARLIKNFYPNGSIVLNDIGAVCYYTDIHLTDLWGLGDKEIGELRLSNNVSPDKIDSIITRRNASIAIIYDLNDHYPKQWQKIADFEINSRVTCADSRVRVYNIRPQELIQNKAKVREFARYLPDGVKQTLY